jgi:hypothetical protein
LISIDQLRYRRTSGLIPEPDDTSPGYREEAVEVVLAVSRALRVPNTVQADVPVIVFAQGYPVPRDVLLASYRRFYRRFRELVPAGTRQGDEADALVTRMLPRVKRSALGRAWIRRSNEYGARRWSTLHDALVSVFQVFLGAVTPEEVDAAALGRVARIFGMSPELAPAVLAVVGMVTIPRMESVLETVSQQELDEARDLLHHVFNIVKLVISDGVLLDVYPGLADFDSENNYAVGMLVPAIVLLSRDIPNYKHDMEAQLIA